MYKHRKAQKYFFSKFSRKKKTIEKINFREKKSCLLFCYIQKRRDLYLFIQWALYVAKKTTNKVEYKNYGC